MDIEKISAIDVHAHFGEYIREPSAELWRVFMSGEPVLLLSRARAANIVCTFASPLAALMPGGRADTAAGNRGGLSLVREQEGLRMWVVVNPLQPESFIQARGMLQDPCCVGIKIHPEEHGYQIAEHGSVIFEMAAETGAIIQAHSGDPNSMPDDFVSFADDFPEVNLILAHLGNGDCPDLQVRAIQAAKHGNIYTDTSSLSIGYSGLLEWAVSEIGAERILFGTDSPLYFAPSWRARLNMAGITDKEKSLILRGNAVELFDIKLNS